MAWTAEKTWNIGDVLSAEDLNIYLSANLQSIAYPPRAYMYRAAALTPAAASTWYAAPFDTVLYDTTGGYSISTTLYTVSVAGVYLVSMAYQINAGVAHATAAAGVTKNGTGFGSVYYQSWMGALQTNTSVNPVGNVSGQVKCVVGDTLGTMYQEYPGTYAWFVGSVYNSYMTILKVSN